jgi:hypothetical protein
MTLLNIDSRHNNYSPTGTMKSVPIDLVRYLISPLNKNFDFHSKNQLLNPEFSNLENAAPRFPAPSLAEVIHNTQLGIYGSTEVNNNQIW